MAHQLNGNPPGTSQGDGRRTKLDYPTTDSRSYALIVERLDVAAKALNGAIESQHLRNATMPNDQVMDDEEDKENT